jgi:hypothetical protein
MKTLILIFTLVLLLIFNPGNQSYSQIVRGTSPGEIYTKTSWAPIYPYLQEAVAICRSTDNGYTLLIQDSIGSDEPYVSWPLLADSASGKLYLLKPYPADSIRRSDDFGSTWIQYPTFPLLEPTGFISGGVSGEIYEQNAGFSNPGLFRSIDFGHTFTGINPNFNSADYILLDVGTEPGEVYGLNGEGSPWWDTIPIMYSNDFGQNFTTLLIDTSILTSNIFSGLPILTRGSLAGEFYLIRKHVLNSDYSQYYIFYTNNYGTTFEFKSITNSILYEWQAYFTGGRAPGSLYIMRWTLDSISEEYSILCIDYSSDYGATFTTFCHDLTPGYTAIEQRTNSNKDALSQNYPNPFSYTTNIQFNIENTGYITLSLLNIQGEEIKTLINHQMDRGNHAITWNGTDNNGNELKPGLYFYQLKVNNIPLSPKKLVIMR